MILKNYAESRTAPIGMGQVVKIRDPRDWE